MAPEDVQTRAEFGKQLERRRARSGRSLRDLAREISATCAEPISYSALGEWCRGARLPLPSRYDAFRRLLTLLGVTNPEPWIDAVIRIRATGRRSATERSPYLGLKSFGPEDAGRFFGRNDLIDRAFARFQQVVNDQSIPRMVWIVGVSGAGKSSLLQAGLRPVLEASGTRCLSMAPGAHPADHLATTLADGLSIDIDIPDNWRHIDPEEWLAEVRTSTDRSLEGIVIIVDQFEELFRECKEDDQREAFLALLSELVNPTSNYDVAVVVGLRVDFYKDAAAHDKLIRPLEDAQILVGPVDRSQLAQCITEPARQSDTTVEDGLVALIQRDLVPSGSIAGLSEPGSLPLLAHTLHETWHGRAHSNRMTIDDYDAAGGIGGAIEASAERVYEQLSTAEQALVRQIFVRLVNVRDENVATRRTVASSELEGLEPNDSRRETNREKDDRGSTDSAVTKVVDYFVQQRLLTAHETTVEIAHESLLVAWPRLRWWIEQNREDLAFHRRITDAAQAWIEADRDPSMLASGMRLEAMQAWRDDTSPHLHLTQEEVVFLDASEARAAAAERSQRRQARRLRTLAGVAAAFALAASSLAVLVNDARNEATQARDQALSRQIAVNAEQLRQTDPSLAAQLAVAGYGIAPTVEARSAVLSTNAFPMVARYLGGSGPTAIAAVPDGSLSAVSNSSNGTVQLFTRAGDTLHRAGIIGPSSADAVYALAFTPNGHYLVIGGTSEKIQVWDTSDPARPHQVGEPLSGPVGQVERLVIGLDGTELAAAGQGNGVFRWDISDPSAPRPLATLPSPSATWSIAYHPDGQHVAVSNDTGDVTIWAIGDEADEITRLTTSGQPVFSVALSPDGDFLAAGGQDGHLYVWDVSTLTQPRRIEVSQGRASSWVNTVVFSDDDRYLVAGSSDLGLRIWDRSSWELVATVAHPAPLTNALFVEGGQTIVTAAADGTSRWWDLASVVPALAEGRVWGLSYDRTGERMAMVTGSEVRVWEDSSEPTDRVLLTQVRDLAGTENGLSGTGALSPDASLLALGGRSFGEVYVVDITNPDSPQLAAPPLDDANDLVEVVAFSPDGSALAAGGDDTDIRLWTVEPSASPALQAKIDDPTGRVLSLSWSPNGRYLAAASTSSVFLFDVADLARPVQVAELKGFEAEAYAVTFSPDGKVLATGAAGGSVILWDVTDTTSPQRIGEPLTGPQARIMDLAYNPSSTYLAAAVADGSVWVWDATDPEAAVPLAVLGPDDEPMYQVEFDPATGLLASAGAGGRLFLWDPDVERAIEAVCTTAGDPITEEEWATYFPDTPYARPCPS